MDDQISLSLTLNRRSVTNPSDETVLIEFMQHLRRKDPVAHEIYQQLSKNRPMFLKAIRIYLNDCYEKQKVESKKDEEYKNEMDTKEEEMEKWVANLTMNDSEEEVTINKKQQSFTAIKGDTVSKEILLPQLSSSLGREYIPPYVLQPPLGPVLPRTGQRPALPVSLLSDHLSSRFPPPLSTRTSSIASIPPKRTSDMTVSFPLEMISPTRNKPTIGSTKVPPIKSLTGIPTMTSKNSKWIPKRTLTKIEQQPCQLIVNNISPTHNGYPHILLGPRKELQVTWKVPISYLNDQMISKKVKNQNINDALNSLTIGLFRRGTSENGTNFSIVSKEIYTTGINIYDDKPSNNTRRNGQQQPRYTIQHQKNIIIGTMPFYTPRTPGNFVLRLYFEQDPIITLATSQSIKVQVQGPEYESTVRFILNNFKSKKNTTHIASIQSFAMIIQEFNPSNIVNGASNTKSINKLPKHYPQSQNQQQKLDGAARATWGCICEARKVMDNIKLEYLKKKEKLRGMELEWKSPTICTKTIDESTSEEAIDDIKRDKVALFLSENGSNEKKWRDVQSAFASILKAVSTNYYSHLLLDKRDMLQMRLEYELWCPLCEHFAPTPFQHDISICDSIEENHFYAFHKSRSDMQKKLLGFIPITTNVCQLIKKDSRNVYNQLSNIMESVYQITCQMNISVQRRNEETRLKLESIVNTCEAIPSGTRVVIFGSSANGFGSPKSDLDMCLQLPPSISILNLNDTTGATAMAKLAEVLKDAGMFDVNTSRLGARIPVVMFQYPIPNSQNLIECDISMQNPLASLNTCLLRSYSNLTPKIRILASIIKRWAKCRDINSPSHHTLSSYGYIIMLLHFLTTHTMSSNGMIIPLVSKSNKINHAFPLIPNLQLLPPNWLHSNHTYEELLRASPTNQQFSKMKHPTEADFLVNSYFFPILDRTVVIRVQQYLQHHWNTLPPVAILLAGFYQYYAYEFDYKRHIVSLRWSPLRKMERDEKAESDFWKLSSQTLSIEDPFETFYDIAHVLKSSNFHRTRKEFALAYSKIANAIDGSIYEKNVGITLLNQLCEPVRKE